LKKSKQDEYYLNSEGDNFFKRNFANKEIPDLRLNKKIIYDEIKESGISYKRVLEFGGNYGDLLYNMKQNNDAVECFNVEASKDAIEFGQKNFQDSVNFVHGTIANNDITNNEKFENYFDLIIIDDVLDWVSRETIFQSVTNIDNLLKDGGFIFIRDFYPDKNTKNQNHHVKNGFVYNFKVKNSHAGVFLASGIYQIEWQKIFFDKIGFSTNYKSDNLFNYRWTDVILRKSYSGFFSESKQLKS
tara:strand:- start:6249 stop:6980 length:732 start_codon:yes stop_codon:yes gene_type:complete